MLIPRRPACGQLFMMASRKRPMATAAPMAAARITPMDSRMPPVRPTLSLMKAYGPTPRAHTIPTARPPTSRPAPIFRLFPLPKYAVKAPVMTRKRLKVNRSTVTNVIGSNALKPAMIIHSEFDPGESLRVDHARDRPYLVHDDLAEDVEILRLDLRDEVVLAEQRVQFHNLLHLQEFVVHLVLLRGSCANEHEPNGHPRSPRRKDSVTI